MAEHEGVAQAPVADPEPLQPNAPEAAEPAQAQHVDEVLQEDAASEARSVAAASSCGGPQLASTARDCGELLHSSEPTACDERWAAHAGTGGYPEVLRHHDAGSGCF